MERVEHKEDPPEPPPFVKSGFTNTPKRRKFLVKSGFTKDHI